LSSEHFQQEFEIGLKGFEWQIHVLQDKVLGIKFKLSGHFHGYACLDLKKVKIKKADGHIRLQNPQ